MSNKQSNLKNSNIKTMKTMKTTINTNENIDEQLDISENQYNELQFDTKYEENDAMKEAEKADRKKLDKPIKIFGTICIAAAIASFIFTGKSTVDTSESAKNALKNKVSTAISAGTILLSKDENTQAQNYTITHKSDAKDTKIWVWDYAGEDGDYVQVLVDGAPLGEAFMIRHKPKEIIVPAVGEVQIKGIKDGGGGITYAVRYDINGTSYFNGTPEGELNTYTLIRE
jgi:hypothetical protein